MPSVFHRSRIFVSVSCSATPHDATNPIFVHSVQYYRSYDRIGIATIRVDTLGLSTEDAFHNVETISDEFLMAAYP